MESFTGSYFSGIYLCCYIIINGILVPYLLLILVPRKRCVIEGKDDAHSIL